MKRRTFLAGGVALGAGAGIDRLLGSSGSPVPAEAAETDPLDITVPFYGAHQAGIVTPQPRQAIFIAFDAVEGALPTEITEALRALSVRAELNTRAHAAPVGAPIGAPIGTPQDGPTPDSGLLGLNVKPDALTVTIGFGATLFAKVDLADRKPRHLTAMPVFADDDIDPARTHGDVLVQLCAGTQETVIHALRDLMRVVRGTFAPRWKVEGFLAEARPDGAPRNLLGFKDGSANPTGSEVGPLIWVDANSGEPSWAVGGSYGVARIIRNRVEFWDRVGRAEQELMIGREKITGRPLDGTRESDVPDYAKDPKGDTIPLDAHIRLANPRTGATTDAQRILRRSFNYSEGIDQAGQLDQGLMFMAFQKDPEAQFATIQKRLAGEPLVDYVVPVGGGYFFFPPGARDGGDWVGSKLFA